MNNIRVLLVLVLLVTGVVAPSKKIASPKKSARPTSCSQPTQETQVTTRKRKSNPTGPSTGAPATAACSSSSSSRNKKRKTTHLPKKPARTHGRECTSVKVPPPQDPSFFRKRGKPKKLDDDGYGRINVATKYQLPDLRLTVELHPESTTFQHIKGERYDNAERNCSPWAGNNADLFGRNCPQVWGESGEKNREWAGYDANCPLQMNGGSGQYAASHVYIKIKGNKQQGEWVIPLSGFANSYANAKIWNENSYTPTPGYTETWHQLRVTVTAIQISRSRSRRLGGSRRGKSRRQQKPTRKTSTRKKTRKTSTFRRGFG